MNIKITIKIIDKKQIQSHNKNTLQLHTRKQELQLCQKQLIQKMDQETTQEDKLSNPYAKCINATTTINTFIKRQTNFSTSALM